MATEINGRIGCAWMAFRQLQHNVFLNKRMKLETKLSLYKTMVFPALLYACESWAPSTENWASLRRIHALHLTMILGCFKARGSKERRVSYAQLTARAGCDTVEATVRARQLLWLGKVIRMEDSRLPKKLLCGDITILSDRGSRKKYYRPAPGAALWRKVAERGLELFGLLKVNDDKVPDWTLDEHLWKILVDNGREHFMDAWRTNEAAAAMKRKRARAKKADSVPGLAYVEQVQKVQCDSCHKWRKLPLRVDKDLLPDKWTCEMTLWNKGRAKCSVEEEVDDDVPPQEELVEPQCTFSAARERFLVAKRAAEMVLLGE